MFFAIPSIVNSPTIIADMPATPLAIQLPIGPVTAWSVTILTLALCGSLLLLLTSSSRHPPRAARPRRRKSTRLKRVLSPSAPRPAGPATQQA